VELGCLISPRSQESVQPVEKAPCVACGGIIAGGQVTFDKYGKGEIFSVTNLGYKVADEIKEKKSRT